MACDFLKSMPSFTEMPLYQNSSSVIKLPASEPKAVPPVDISSDPFANKGKARSYAQSESKLTDLAGRPSPHHPRLLLMKKSFLAANRERSGAWNAHPPFSLAQIQP